MSDQLRRLTRRQFAVGAGAAAGAAWLAACGTGASAPQAVQQAKGKIGFAMWTFKSPRIKNVDLPAFDKAVRGAGWDLRWDQADDDQAKVATIVDNLTTLGVKALAIFPQSGPPTVESVRKATQAGIPVIAYNTAIPSGDVKAFVARDNVAVGESIAQAAMKDQGLTGNWVIVSGPQDNAVASEMTKGFFNVIQPRISDGKMKVVSHEWHKAWDTNLARAQAENALTKYKDDVSGFLVNNDGMAVGVVSALDAAKLAGQAWVNGQDASEPIIRAILMKKVRTSSFTKFDEMGKLAGELAVRLANGETIKADKMYETGTGQIPLFIVPAYNVTRDNVVEYLKQYSPDYVNAKNVFAGIPESDWPSGAKELLGR